MDSMSASNRRAIFFCCFYGFGIIATLLVYGLLQERIMTMEYGGELFETSIFLVFCNRVVAILFALVLAMFSGESLCPQAPLWRYCVVSFSNVFASTCQYEALKYVAFAVQMLAKSFKMLPVMLWSIMISGKKYKPIDWMIAIIITWGVTQFLLTGPIESHAGAEINNPSKGIILLFCFLALDGLTSTMQEKLFREYASTKYNQMIYVNICSAAISFITLVSSGALRKALLFCEQHDAFARDAIVLSSAAVSGQWFIYSQITEFGALVFAATMNVRQLVSILASNKTFDHAITPGQWIGIALVFGALFLKSYIGLSSDVEHASESTPLKPDKNDPGALEAAPTPETVPGLEKVPVPAVPAAEEPAAKAALEGRRRGCVLH